MNDTSLPLIGARLFGTPLLVEPGRGGSLLHSLADRLKIDRSALPALLDQPVPQAMAGTARTAQQNGYDMAGDIAVIRAHGPLAQRVGGMEALCGMTSYERIASALHAALADPAVAGVMLDIDSPGGEVSGCFDLARVIREARGVKPIRAHANEWATSAACAIGVAADRFTIAETGVTGSVGVVCFHVDRSEAQSKAGLTVTPIQAGARKTELSDHAPLTEAAQSNLQTEINRVWDIFITHVATSRNLTADAVKGQEAACLHGPEAVTAGMADAVMPFADAMAEFQSDLNPQESNQGDPNMDPTPTAAAAPPAAPTAATEAAPANPAPTVSAEALVNLAAAAGLPQMAQSLIQSGLDLEQATQKLAEGKAIKSLCAKGVEQGLEVDLTDDLLTAGASLDSAQTMITNLLAKQDEAIGGSAGVSPEGARKAATDATASTALPDPMATWQSYRQQMTGKSGG
ncbi:MAG: S49 family peptidase [Alphaproteobacteria bacterium]